MKTLLALLLLFAFPVQSQTYLPLTDWRFMSFGETTILEWPNAANHDSISAEVIPESALLWSLPRTMRTGEVDSIGVWASVAPNQTLTILTAWNHNNWNECGTCSFNGPIEYREFKVPFELSRDTAKYIVAHVTEASSTKGEHHITVNQTYTLIDAACIYPHGMLRVAEHPTNKSASCDWYNLLGKRVFTGTLEQAREKLGPDLYITSNAQKFFITKP